MTPEISLAFAIQSNPGVYAVLLGSGISRAAGIPTGWEVVLDLVRKLAVVQGEDCEPDPAAWYQTRYGVLPGYSELLDVLARTPAERQQILRAYFEPALSEAEEGKKSPTKAHRAIAKLVSNGHIRVILTTNFDRLMERALQDEGVAPTVISTVDQIEGAIPLTHIQCCVLKLHGDYLDTRILNTPEELATYDPRLNSYLDRIIDEFGLVVCGWSADWDEALRNAIERAPNRRYSMYFAVRGSVSEKANALLGRRAGVHIPIADADTFFETLHTKVEAIEQFSQPHPLSVKAAVVACKRFLADPQTSRIRLSDLIAGEASRVCKELVSGDLSNTNEAISSESVTTRVRRYDALLQTLVGLSFQCGRWGGGEAVECLTDMQRRLYGTKSMQGINLWLAYQVYPVSLVTFAALLGASIRERCEVVRPLLVNILESPNGQPVLAVDLVPPFLLLSESPVPWGQLLEGKANRNAPVNEWICEVLWAQVGEEFATKGEFEFKFDWVEIVLAMANHKLSPPVFNANFHPPGSYGYRRANLQRNLRQISQSLDRRIQRVSATDSNREGVGEMG